MTWACRGRRQCHNLTHKNSSRKKMLHAVPGQPGYSDSVMDRVGTEQMSQSFVKTALQLSSSACFTAVTLQLDVSFDETISRICPTLTYCASGHIIDLMRVQNRKAKYFTSSYRAGQCHLNFLFPRCLEMRFGR
jgi:hypothetical protein